MTTSVVIATYNRSQMVGQAIHAALSQTRPPDEIVVVNDASTDSTGAVLDRLAAAHPTLRVFHLAANSGGVAIWNDAVARARGELIAICTDDDWFLPQHLEASADYLERNPRVGVVHCSFIDVLETGSTRTLEPRPLRSPEPLESNRGNLLPYMTRFYDWPFHASTLVFRRELWTRTGGFDPRYTLADTDWFVRAVELAPAVMLPRHGVHNRRHAGNWSNRLGSARMQREIFEIVEQLIARQFERRPLTRAAWRAIWRADVRLHLLLTLLARCRSGHAEAACAAWHGMLQDTGRQSPAWLERYGQSSLRSVCESRRIEPAAQQPSVHPL